MSDRDKIVLVVPSLLSGVLMGFISHSLTIALGFASAIVAVELVYHELRQISRSLKEISEKLGRSSLIGL